MTFGLEATASAGPSEGYNRMEAGLSAGAFLPAKDHALFDPINNDPVPLKTAGLNLQLHLAFFPIRYAGLEVEGGFVPMKTVRDGSTQILLARGHLIAQLPWRVTPFLLGGAGFIGITSSRDVLGNDVAKEIHWGGGLKFYATEAVSLRLDVRDLISAKLDDVGGARNELAHHFEVFAGITVALWRTPDEIEPPIEIAFADRTYPDPPPGLPLPDANAAAARIDVARPLDCTKAAENPLCTPEETIKAELNRVHFAWGSWKMSPQEASAIENAAEILRAHPELAVEIDGHADATGPEGFNGWLSLRRAKVVMEYLVHVGIEDRRLTIRGFGSTKPTAPNQTADGRASNRRSEIRILRELRPEPDKVATEQKSGTPD